MGLTKPLYSDGSITTNLLGIGSPSLQFALQTPNTEYHPACNLLITSPGSFLPVQVYRV